jgi:uncharacterized protein
MKRAKPETKSSQKGKATAAWRQRMPQKAAPEELAKLLFAEIAAGPEGCDIRRVRALLARGLSPDVKDDEDPALVLATRQNLVPVIKALLEAGAAVDAPCDRGQTALLVTSYRGFPEAAVLLLAHGANPNIPYEEDWPLGLAVNYGYTEIVKAMLDKGALLNVQDSYGKTPLHRAAFGGHDDIVEALLQKGADVDITDNDGRTPLMWAALRQRRSSLHGPDRRLIRIAKMLLDAGADTRPRGDKDRPALALADESRQREIKELISSAEEKNDREALATGLPLKKPMTVGLPLRLKIGAKGPE